MRDAKPDSARIERSVDAIPSAGLEPTLRAGVRSGASPLPRGRAVPAPRTAVPAVSSMQVRGRAQSMAITLSRMLGAVESRIVTVMAHAAAPAERQEARLELGLLVRIRNGLQGQTGAQEDAVLSESLVEFAESVQQTLADLEAGGTRRVRRLLAFDRELLSELAAFGGSAQPHKAAWQKACDMLAQGQEAYVEHATREALNLYTRLTGELDRRCPRSRGTLLDEMLRP